MRQPTLAFAANRLTTWLMPFLLCIGLAACGGNSEDTMTSDSPTDTTAAVTTLAAISQTSPDHQKKPKKKDAGLFFIAGSIGGAGSVDATGVAARFNNPYGIAADSVGNLYVADTNNNTIRKVTAAGVVTTLAGSAGVQGNADGSGATARFNQPRSIAADTAGNLYVADAGNATIRKVTAAGVVTTLAGTAGVFGSADGSGTAAQFYAPFGITADTAGNLYVADDGNNTIRKITAAGVVTTLAGTAGMTGSADGSGAAAQFSAPFGIAADPAGNLYVADAGNRTIRKITAAGVVTTLAGTPGVVGSADGTGAAAQFYNPGGIAADTAGNVYVADTNNSTIRKITAAGVVTTLAGTSSLSGTGGSLGSADGSGAAAQFYDPYGIAADTAGNLYVADTINNTIRKVTATGVVTTLAGTAGVVGSADGSGAAAQFNTPIGIATDPSGNLYVADTFNNTIRKVTAEGVVTTLAGTAGVAGSADGTGAAAQFYNPVGIAADTVGNLYVADTKSNTIRKITAAGIVTTLAGTAGVTGSADGSGAAAQFYAPIGIAADTAGNLYVADTGNRTIRKITAAGVVTTLAGTAGVLGSADGSGPAAQFNSPSGIAADTAGNLYVVDMNSRTIRKITAAGVVTTLAGTAGVLGSADGSGAAAQFNSPGGIAADTAGNLYVADTLNNTIRKITAAGVVSTVAGVAGKNGIVLGSLPGSLSSPQGVTVTGANTVALTSANSVLELVFPEMRISRGPSISTPPSPPPSPPTPPSPKRK